MQLVSAPSLMRSRLGRAASGLPTKPTALSLGSMPARESRPGAPVKVGAFPDGIAVGHSLVWVANFQDGTVTRIDASSGRVVGRPIPVGGFALAIAMGNGALYVTNGLGAILQIDPSSGTLVGAARGVGTALDAIAVSNHELSGRELSRQHRHSHQHPIRTRHPAAHQSPAWPQSNRDRLRQRVGSERRCQSSHEDRCGLRQSHERLAQRNELRRNHL